MTAGIRLIDRHVRTPSDGRPECAGVPSTVKRRFTDLTRAVIDPFLEVCRRTGTDASRVAVVLASAHGEIRILEKLLDEMARGQTLSPIDFCNSVHHTATGYLSIAVSNRGIARTVSAGDRTFEAGLLETFVLLVSGRADRVALLVGDEAVPAVFGAPATAKAPCPGAALLFAAGDGDDALCADDIARLFAAGDGLTGFLKGQAAP